MLYGERLLLAMQQRSEALGQDIARKDIARVAGVSPQNVGMIINNAMGRDQKLGTRAHAAVCDYLKIRSEWLLNETGPMQAAAGVVAPTHLTAAALELAVLFDMIPVSDKIRRARAFNAASTAVMQSLQSEDAKA